jgi:hypothetical protein
VVTTSRNSAGPFQALEQDWVLVCRRHRRPGAIAGWAEQEHALAGIQRLADVIPSPEVDRAPLCAAVARLHVAGDDLAGRTLLQLLVPGMCRLTALWMNRLPGGVSEAAWEVITRSHLYIEHLRERHIRCSPAGYILRSVHRDLLIDASNAARTVPVAPVWDDDQDDDHPTFPSAEDVACSGPLFWSALRDAFRASTLPRDSVRTVGLLLSGHSIEEVADRTFNSVASTYRHRTRVRKYLHDRHFAVAN